MPCFYFLFLCSRILPCRSFLSSPVTRMSQNENVIRKLIFGHGNHPPFNIIFKQTQKKNITHSEGVFQTRLSISHHLLFFSTDPKRIQSQGKITTVYNCFPSRERTLTHTNREGYPVQIQQQQQQ